ncbi:hypothetical protein AB1L88_24325 [Tautonia sp. JC769]|uniref:hypothetical protein n=1 Tax=Tautonia sp. JC769 TaxID=3232135 RepID=UPI00345812BB
MTDRNRDPQQGEGPDPDAEGHRPDEATRSEAEQAARNLPGYTPQARDDHERPPEGSPGFTPMGRTDNQEP